MSATPEITNAAQGSVLDQEGQDILCAVENDWRRMCGNGSTPQLLDPYRMDLALPYTFILQRTAPGAARIRVAGQVLHNMVGLDPRGMTFGTFFSDGGCETVLELVEAALTLPAIIRIPLTAPRGFGRKAYRAEALLLPLRDAKGDLNRIMGVIVPETPLKAKTVNWSVDASRELHCEVQNGNFPDRRVGPRQALPTKQGLRLVVDNTRDLQSA